MRSVRADGARRQHHVAAGVAAYAQSRQPHGHGAAQTVAQPLAANEDVVTRLD